MYSRLLKSVIILTLLGSMLFLTNCAKGVGETTLSVSFADHPDGGTNVTSVSATIRADRNFNDKSTLLETKPEPDPISVTVEWWWENAFGAGDQILKTESFVVESNTKTFTTTFNASSGFVLVNYFWVKVSWTDKDENSTQRTLESSKAYCRQ
jgi:hypothetical protein